jgi:hypothetical protein
VAAVLVIAGIAAFYGRQFLDEPPQTATAPPAVTPPVAPPVTPPVTEPVAPPSAQPEQSTPGNPQPDEKQEPVGRPSPVDKPVEPTPEPLPPRPPAPTETVFEVRTMPAGAQVEFDSNPSLRCTSPCGLPLLPGRHTLLATLNGHQVERRIFEMPKQASMTISLRVLTGTLLIESEPSGATVFIDGNEQSRKTPMAITLPVGKHRVIVSFEGAGRREFETDVQDGPPKTIKAEFK